MVKYNSVPKQFKTYLQRILRRFQSGVSLDDFLKEFENLSGAPLDCTIHGFYSMEQFVVNLKDVFVVEYKSPGKEIWVYPSESKTSETFEASKGSSKESGPNPFKWERAGGDAKDNPTRLELESGMLQDLSAQVANVKRGVQTTLNFNGSPQFHPSKQYSVEEKNPGAQETGASPSNRTEVGPNPYKWESRSVNEKNGPLDREMSNGIRNADSGSYESSVLKKNHHETTKMRNESTSHASQSSHTRPFPAIVIEKKIYLPLPALANLVGIPSRDFFDFVLIQNGLSSIRGLLELDPKSTTHEAVRCKMLLRQLEVPDENEPICLVPFEACLGLLSIGSEIESEFAVQLKHIDGSPEV